MKRMKLKMKQLVVPGFAMVLWLIWGSAGFAQETRVPEKFNLKRAVALAVQNSRELALARLRHTLAEQSAAVTRAEFRPNLYAGSGAGYTNGIPQTPGGAAPSIFSVAYIQTLLNAPLRGELRAAEERARAGRFEVESARDAVILRTASSYLELAKVRHVLELLRRERESAQKIVEIARERASAGIELRVEIIRAELTAAQIEQRIVQLEGQEEALDAELHKLMGVPADERIEVSAEELPAMPDLKVAELVEMAMANNPQLKQVESERRAWAHRLKGEQGGRFPTLDLVGEYSVLSRINNFDVFFNRFQRHNLNVGVQVRVPIFSARSSAATALARTNLNAAELELKTKRSDLEIEVRRQARRTRELDVAREVARLELQLAQESLRILQAQFEEQRVGLRDLEKARLEESEKWMGFLEANHQRQRAELELLRNAGQLARLLQ